LRAARIANPQDIGTFLKAIFTGISFKSDPDVYSRVGLDAPDKGIFKDVYAPGSIVKLWHEEIKRAQELAEFGDQTDGMTPTWRSDVFDDVTHGRNSVP